MMLARPLPTWVGQCPLRPLLKRDPASERADTTLISPLPRVPGTLLPGLIRS